MDVVAAVLDAGGVARTAELRALGCAPRAITNAVRRGHIVRFRTGWFGLPSLARDVARAHGAGRRPACATVAAARGLWMLSPPCLHIEVPKSAGRKASTDGVTRHWATRGGGSRLGQDLLTALVQMAACTDPLDAICAIDDALHRGLVTIGDLWNHANPMARTVIAMCDARAESGVESVFRVRAARAGYVFRIQATLPGARVDFLFGDRLVVETDGSEFHSGHEEFAKDRNRDAWLAALGYRVLRLSYDQVINRWHEVESVLALLHVSGEHLGRERTRSPRRTRR